MESELIKVLVKNNNSEIVTFEVEKNKLKRILVINDQINALTNEQTKVFEGENIDLSGDSNIDSQIFQIFLNFFKMEGDNTKIMVDPTQELTEKTKNQLSEEEIKFFEEFIDPNDIYNYSFLYKLQQASSCLNFVQFTKAIAAFVAYKISDLIKNGDRYKIAKILNIEVDMPPYYPAIITESTVLSEETKLNCKTIADENSFALSSTKEMEQKTEKFVVPEAFDWTKVKEEFPTKVYENICKEFNLNCPEPKKKGEKLTDEDELADQLSGMNVKKEKVVVDSVPNFLTKELSKLETEDKEKMEKIEESKKLINFLKNNFEKELEKTKFIDESSDEEESSDESGSDSEEEKEKEKEKEKEDDNE